MLGNFQIPVLRSLRLPLIMRPKMTPSPDHQPEFYEGILAKRFFAWCIDSVLILLLCLILLPFTGFVGLFFLLPMMAVVGFIYRAATLSSSSATWGMRFTGMELRDANDRRLDGVTALLHTAGYSVSIAVAPLQVISVILMCISERHQGLTDALLGTIALNRRRSA